MAQMNMVQAINDGLRFEMKRDDRVVVLGEDVGRVGGVFRVTGWTVGDEPAEGWSSVFAIYAGKCEVPPMLGTYTVEDGSLVFRPRYPLAPGMHIRAVLRGVETTFDQAFLVDTPCSRRFVEDCLELSGWSRNRAKAHHATSSFCVRSVSANRRTAAANASGLVMAPR